MNIVLEYLVYQTSLTVMIFRFDMSCSMYASWNLLVIQTAFIFLLDVAKSIFLLFFLLSVIVLCCYHCGSFDLNKISSSAHCNCFDEVMFYINKKIFAHIVIVIVKRLPRSVIVWIGIGNFKSLCKIMCVLHRFKKVTQQKCI